MNIKGILAAIWIIGFQSAAAQAHRPHAGHHGPYASAWLSGKVMEKDSTAVAFATVCLKGTNYGGTTDDKGLSVSKRRPGSIRWSYRLSATGPSRKT